MNEGDVELCELLACIALEHPRGWKPRKMSDDDDGSAALAAMRERLAALTQPAAGGMGQALEVAAMQDALATKLAASQARIDALMAGPSESDPPAADDEVLEWQRKIAALGGTPTLPPPPAPAAPPPAAPGAAELKAAAAARGRSAAADADAEYWRRKMRSTRRRRMRAVAWLIAEQSAPAWRGRRIERVAARGGRRDDDDAGGGCCAAGRLESQRPRPRIRLGKYITVVASKIDRHRVWEPPDAHVQGHLEELPPHGHRPKRELAAVEIEPD